MNRVNRRIVVALVVTASLLQTACDSSVSSPPITQPTFSAMFISNAEKLAEGLRDTEADERIQCILFKGPVPIVKLSVRRKMRDADAVEPAQTAFETLLPSDFFCPDSNDQSVHGYLIVSVPHVSRNTSGRPIRARFIPLGTESSGSQGRIFQRKWTEIFTTSELPERDLPFAIESQLMPGDEWQSSSLKTLPAPLGFQGAQWEVKTSLLGVAPTKQQFREQATSAAKSGRLSRKVGVDVEFGNAPDAEPTAPEEAEYWEFVRGEFREDGQHVSTFNTEVSLITPTNLGVKVGLHALMLNSMTFEVQVTSNDTLVQATHLQVPRGDVGMFLVQPKVELRPMEFRRMGVAVRWKDDVPDEAEPASEPRKP